MITPEGKEIKYNYDISHRLTQIQAPSPLWGEGGGEGKTSASTLTFAFTYDTTGRRTKLTYPNGVTTNYTYDSIGRLTNLLTQYAELQSQGKRKPPILKLHTIDSFTYTHDKVGNRLSEVSSVTHGFSHDTGSAMKKDYTYDAIYRLLESTPSRIGHNGREREFEHKAEVFTYDVVGNRLTSPKDKLNYTYNQGNQLTELLKLSSPHRGEDEGEGESSLKKKVEFTYDKNGNLIKKVELDDDGQIKRTTIYSYDYENRLIKVEIQKGDRLKIVSFTYDPFGRRLSKTVHREEVDDDDDNDRDDDDHITPRATYYIYDNEDIILEYNHKGKIRARYIHGLGIDEPLAVEQKGKVYYYHLDGLGSVTALTDSKGKVVQRYEYDSFGKLKRHGNKVKNSYTYTGREWDKETGLYYYRARYYDAKMGRFISKDPFPGYLDNPQTLNPYPYVGNNPMNFIDPAGLFWGGIITKGGGKGILSGGPGALTGGIIGGFAGAGLGTLTGIPGMTFVGGTIGGYVGGKIGGYFDPEHTGRLNYKEDEMLKEWRKRNNCNK